MFPKQTNNTRTGGCDIRHSSGAKVCITSYAMKTSLVTGFQFLVGFGESPQEVVMPSAQMYKRFFTPDEANGLLPEVRTLLETAKRLLDEARLASRSLEEAQTDEARSDAYCQVEERRSAINQILTQLRHRGVEIKGLNPILVTFPALRNGQQVYLCWSEGENQITSWHPMHTGITGRQTLDPKQLGYWEWCN